MVLEKRVFENTSLGPVIRLLIGKVPQRGSTPLSPNEVSTSQVEGSMTISQSIEDTQVG